MTVPAQDDGEFVQIFEDLGRLWTARRGKEPCPQDAPIPPDEQCQQVVGTFNVTADLLAECLGVPPGYRVTAAHPAEDGSIQIVVVGSGVPGTLAGKLQLVIEEERGHGLFGGVIRRTRFEPI